MQFKQPITYPNGLKVSIHDDHLRRFPGQWVEVSVYDTVDNLFVTKKLLRAVPLDANKPNDGLFVYIPENQLTSALQWAANWSRPGKNIS